MLVVAHVIIVSAPVQKIGYWFFQTWSRLKARICYRDWDLDLGLTKRKGAIYMQFHGAKRYKLKLEK